jgi:hypothetical protein
VRPPKVAKPELFADKTVGRGQIRFPAQVLKCRESLFLNENSLLAHKKFPVTLDRESDHKLLNFRAEWGSDSLNGA